MRTLVAVLLLVLLVGCGSDPLGPLLSERLPRLGGCADVIFFAVDRDDQVMVTFRADGLVAAARKAGTETSTTFTFPIDDADLVVEQGSRISDATCDDAIENGGPRVDRTWTAVSGTATVWIRPREDTSGGHGDLLLEEVVFTSAGGDTVSLDRLEWVDVPVGWYPG